MNHIQAPQISTKARSELDLSPKNGDGRRASSNGSNIAPLGDISRILRCECVAIASVLPRGTLELVRVEFSCFDRRGNNGRITDDLSLYAESIGWAALAGLDSRNDPAKPRTDADVQLPASNESEAQPHIAGVLLPDSVFDGYPGVLLAYRGPDDRQFSADDLKRLSTAAVELSETLRSARHARLADVTTVIADDLPVDQRFIALTAALKPWSMASAFAAMDSELRTNVVDAAKRLVKESGDEASIEDITIDDSLGHRHSVRLVTRPMLHPATKSGASGRAAAENAAEKAADTPRVLCCFTPPVLDWMRLVSDDFAGNAEIARLVPAIEFMTRDVAHQPGLNQIARAVNLSPFHFHRRFSELFGITPKHLLLATQIAHARRLLAEDDQPLAEIARVCGFAHQSHFTSRFKQATGMTPTRWRRVQANASSNGTANGAANGATDESPAT